MTASYYPMDPSFRNNAYPESGTTGYDGKGWYYFYGGQLWGPFDIGGVKDGSQNKSFS